MRSSASWTLEAIRRSQFRTIACSTAIRCSGSTIAPSAAPLLAQDRLAEVGEQVEEARLLDVLGGPDGQARHPAALGQPDPVRPLLTRPPGEDLGVDAAPAQLLAHRPYVDVHPTVFARPQGGDRRGVQADDRERFQMSVSFCVLGRHPIVAVWSPRGQLRTRSSALAKLRGLCYRCPDS